MGREQVEQEGRGGPGLELSAVGTVAQVWEQVGQAEVLLSLVDREEQVVDGAGGVGFDGGEGHAVPVREDGRG